MIVQLLRTYIQEQFDTFRLPVGRGAVQGRPQIIVPGLDLGPVFNQGLHDPGVAVDACQVEGGVGVRVLVVYGELVTAQNLLADAGNGKGKGLRTNEPF